MQPTTSTSVIIPHYTGADRQSALRATIDGVLSQSCAKQTEVIVICNPPSQEASDLQSLYGSKISVLSAPTANVNIARNLGLRTAVGRNLVFLDDDCVLSSKYTIEKMVRSLEQDHMLIACGGDYQPAANAKFWDKIYSRIQRNWMQSSQLPDSTSENLFGGFLAVKANELGGIEFEEAIAFGGAELSFVHQLRGSGKKVKWLPEFKVNHMTSMNFFDFVRRAYKQGQTSGKFPDLAVSRIVHRNEMLRKTRGEILFQLFFNLGSAKGDKPYARALLHFIKEFTETFSWIRHFKELRTLAVIKFRYRDLLK